MRPRTGCGGADGIHHLAVLACFIPGRDDSLINNNPVLYDTVVAWFRL